MGEGREKHTGLFSNWAVWNNSSKGKNTKIREADEKALLAQSVILELNIYIYIVALIKTLEDHCVKLPDNTLC